MANQNRHDVVESPLVILRRHVGEEGSFEDGVEIALSNGPNLKSVGLAMGGRAVKLGFDGLAFGGRGPTDTALSDSISIVKGLDRFEIRKKVKDHGTERLVEGARLKKDQEVVVVQALTRTGARLLGTIVDLQEHTGARVVGAMTLVDTEEGTAERLAGELPDTRYVPMFTGSQIEVSAGPQETEVV